MTGTVDGKEITAKEETFTTVKEGWNEYLLDSGVRVRVKIAVAKIGRQVNADGTYKNNEYKDPAVLVRYNVEVVTSLEKDDDSE